MMRTCACMAALAALLSMSPEVHAQTDEEVYASVVAAGDVLAFGTDDEKIAAAAALADLRAVYCVALLEAALADPSSDVRIAVCGALGAIAHEDAVEVLSGALLDEASAVAMAAARALGDMHTDDAYAALLAALGAVKEDAVKKAVLDALRRWNDPFTPLPEPRTLPAGKQPPPLPGEPGEPGGKTIDKKNPYGKTEPGPPPPKITKSIDESNPYGGPSGMQGGPSLSAALKAGSSIDKTNPYEGPSVSYVGEEDTWGSAPEPVQTAPEPQPPEPFAPPALTLALWDLTPASSVSFETATASVDNGTGRATVMQIRGGYSGDHLGAGAVIPFAGGASVDPGGGFEEWVFGNLGLWVRYTGAKELGSVTLSYAGAFTMHLPSGDDVTWSDFGTDPDYFTSMGALYATYYNQGLMYPDLEDSFKVSLRPDFDLGVAVGPLSFQLELGFDFIVLGKARAGSGLTWMKDLQDLVMFHLGLGAYVRPTSWLQLFVELESAIEVSGRSAQTWLFDRSFSGDGAGSEVFITPGVSVLLPMGGKNAAHLTLGLRVPLGEIGSSAGPMQLGPILVLQSGFRWGR
ncbi:MAG: HEAT repeat domain-containing protein [Deltaproteobacteria bacterium]|nr:HEAT repeat domain-containing protein [Deltaproteobacteria bacterium]